MLLTTPDHKVIKGIEISLWVKQNAFFNKKSDDSNGLRVDGRSERIQGPRKLVL